MEIFMNNIALTATSNHIKREIAKAIHGPDYAQFSSAPLNLDVAVLNPRPNSRRRTTARGRTGLLTLPSERVGELFLRQYGDPSPSKTIVFGTRIHFSKSRKDARLDIVERICRTPYVDPVEEEKREAWIQELRAYRVQISSLQFGWECRDNVFSIEWERDCRTCDCIVTFNDDRREFRIEASLGLGTYIVAIRISSILWAAAGLDGNNDPSIFLTLAHPPSFELALSDSLASTFSAMSLGANSSPSRSRLGDLQLMPGATSSHVDVVPFVSNALRLVCRTSSDLRSFRGLCRTVRFQIDDNVYPSERRKLFSEDVRRTFDNWVAKLPWPVAFQVEALARRLLFDLGELLLLHRDIDDLFFEKGVVYTVSFLRHLGIQAKSWLAGDDIDYAGANAQSALSPKEFFAHCLRGYNVPKVPRVATGSLDVFECLHAVVTPTTIRLEGPYPERSNRVIRLFPRDHLSFLRVSFVDENKLHYRFDREIDGVAFIKERVGELLSNGVTIAGRKFDFLAYSQSALKEHAVWFVKPFDEVGGRRVDAATIIRNLGSFDSLEHDPQLVYCPARYGARISQSFTATDSSISVEPGEIKILDDIYDSAGRWCFTDGVGTISPELAKEVWKRLTEQRQGSRRKKSAYPRAYQVRFMGSKGMVSVDHTLTGRILSLRPSMIKFEAPNSRIIEVARAFDKPSPFGLNRPLIMVLEGLGVPYETFYDLQATAVSDAHRSAESLEGSAALLETYGLGASFQLTSVMLSLAKLGLDPPLWDQFWKQMIEFATHHVLRELKYHARIPVPGAWNLVGVADVHGYLKEGEIFVHIVPKNGEESRYLKGRTLVSRSPTIHPGDVQVANAIGEPPPGSPFAQETLCNCVVFSIKGARPLPSCLGGGDLDGDLFCVTTLPGLLPRTTYQAAPYKAAERVTLNRPSTMQDVADFVTEYIYSDNIGIIAKTWLVIADQSPEGILDSDCLKLSALHSDAVDYPKSGKVVPLQELPRYKFRARPDWDAPETAMAANTLQFYESQRAIGRLFRAINLSAAPAVNRVERVQRQQLKEEINRTPTLQDVLDRLHARADENEEDPVREAVMMRVLRFIPLGRHDEDLVAEMWDLFSSYRSQLQMICTDHVLSSARSAMLTEEEAVVGTIVAKTSQPRLRRDTMSRLRENTANLVQDVEHQLEGEDGTLPEKSLERAWVAYRVHLLMQHLFGAKSFGWICLKKVFDAIGIIEKENEGFF